MLVSGKEEKVSLNLSLRRRRSFSFIFSGLLCVSIVVRWWKWHNHAYARRHEIHISHFRWFFADKRRKFVCLSASSLTFANISSCVGFLSVYVQTLNYAKLQKYDEREKSLFIRKRHDGDDDDFVARLAQKKEEDNVEKRFKFYGIFYIIERISLKVCALFSFNLTLSFSQIENFERAKSKETGSTKWENGTRKISCGLKYLWKMPVRNIIFRLWRRLRIVRQNAKATDLQMRAKRTKETQKSNGTLSKQLCSHRFAVRCRRFIFVFTSVISRDAHAQVFLIVNYFYAFYRWMWNDEKRPKTYEFFHSLLRNLWLKRFSVSPLHSIQHEGCNSTQITLHS